MLFVVFHRIREEWECVSDGQIDEQTPHIWRKGNKKRGRERERVGARVQGKRCRGNKSHFTQALINQWTYMYAVDCSPEGEIAGQWFKSIDAYTGNDTDVGSNRSVAACTHTIISTTWVCRLSPRRNRYPCSISRFWWRKQRNYTYSTLVQQKRSIQKEGPTEKWPASVKPTFLISFTAKPIELKSKL